MEQKTSIYTLTSELHDEKAVGAATKAFLESLGLAYELKGTDYSDYGSSGLNIILPTNLRPAIFLPIPSAITISSSPAITRNSSKVSSLHELPPPYQNLTRFLPFLI